MLATEVMNPLRDLDEFTRAYIECALWSSLDDDGNPLDAKKSWTDIARETLQKMMNDCAAFQAANEADIYDFGTPQNAATAGHDFWLTRNGHGAGFWDGDWPQEIGARLTDASKVFGEVNLYIGGDGKIYG